MSPWNPIKTVVFILNRLLSDKSNLWQYMLRLFTCKTSFWDQNADFEQTEEPKIKMKILIFLILIGFSYMMQPLKKIKCAKQGSTNHSVGVDQRFLLALVWSVWFCKLIRQFNERTVGSGSWIPGSKTIFNAVHKEGFPFATLWLRFYAWDYR